MKVSVVVTTYNRPDALDRVLESLMLQDIPPLEVVVADDGSGDETARCIAKWQATGPDEKGEPKQYGGQLVNILETQEDGQVRSILHTWN